MKYGMSGYRELEYPKKKPTADPKIYTELVKQTL